LLSWNKFTRISFTINSNITRPFILRSRKLSLSLQVSVETLYAFLISHGPGAYRR
jgi:hypothetical protein